MIRRRFVDVPGGQVHVREATPLSDGGLSDAGRTPLVMLHASPGSSKQFEDVVAALGRDRRVLAPDTRGNGDSTPLPQDHPEIADFARATLAFLDAAGLDRVDLYGSHTGASIAAELSLLAPGRVRRLILDGMGLYPPEQRDEMLRTYAPAIVPDHQGTHLLWAFMFCRDQSVFWPWYAKGAENRRPTGLPDPGTLHDLTVEVLKSIGTYHRSYRAAFRYPKRERLPLVRVPTLAVTADDDMLRPFLDEVAALVPGAVRMALPPGETPEGRRALVGAIAAFLDA
ncbi:MAG: alpha/beta fold hydrolase [Rhodospirillales bacterium]